MHAPFTSFPEETNSGSRTNLIHIMRAGIKASWIPRIAENLGITQDKLLEQLRLPKSTIKGRIGRDELLSPFEQDRIYRVNRVLERAMQVLEDDEAARMWISHKNRSLGNEAPLSLLDTEVGYELVLDTLGQIEHGVIS